jgi:succinate dehydrogenase/fumarate reductase-like Fe-S protein
VLCGSPPVQHGSPGGGRHALFIAVERGCRNLWCGDCAVARRGRGPVASAAPTTTTEKSLTLRSLVGLS